jgi:hypothetical protein
MKEDERRAREMKGEGVKKFERLGQGIELHTTKGAGHQGLESEPIEYLARIGERTVACLEKTFATLTRPLTTSPNGSPLPSPPPSALPPPPPTPLLPPRPARILVHAFACSERSLAGAEGERGARMIWIEGTESEEGLKDAVPFGWDCDGAGLDG